MINRTDLNVAEVVYISIIFHIPALEFILFLMP